MYQGFLICGLSNVLQLDGRNRATVFAELLARVVAAIRLVFVGGHISPLKTQNLVLVDPSRSLLRDSNRAICVRWSSIRLTLNCGMSCESCLRSLNTSDWRFCPSKVSPLTKTCLPCTDLCVFCNGAIPGAPPLPPRPPKHAQNQLKKKKSTSYHQRGTSR